MPAEFSRNQKTLMASFDRGFKAWAERTSVSLRRELGLLPHSPLSPIQLARHLDVEIWSPNDVKGLTVSDFEQLMEKDQGGWHAITFFRSGKRFMIHNPTHSSARQASDIMHELAHIICGHSASKLILSVDGKTVLRTHDQKQEDEADWLGGTLLLSRAALVFTKQRRLLPQQICSGYSVSQELLRYRLNITSHSAY